MRCFARLRRGLLKERDTHTFTQTVMREALGDDWMSNFASFERVPFAAASIDGDQKSCRRKTPSLSFYARARRKILFASLLHAPDKQ